MLALCCRRIGSRRTDVERYKKRSRKRLRGTDAGRKEMRDMWCDVMRWDVRCQIRHVRSARPQSVWCMMWYGMRWRYVKWRLVWCYIWCNAVCDAWWVMAWCDMMLSLSHVLHIRSPNAAQCSTHTHTHIFIETRTTCQSSLFLTRRRVVAFGWLSQQDCQG